MSQDIQIISVIGANGQPLPINGNSIGSNWNTEVKQERADEAEIAELAAKLVETQKAALAKQQQQAAQLASRQTLAANGLPAMVNTNGQTNILNYLQRQPNKNTAINLNGNATINTNQTQQQQQQQQRNGDTSPDKKAITDEESQKGRFGWTTLAKVHIPYIYRGTEKYCSVRMIEMKLLGKYLNCLHPDIYSSCTCVRSYYISDAEARLLFEINNKHCDNEFGVAQFTPKDLVVRLSDATKFHQFLEICYRKLMSGSKSPSEKCGFIRINKESVVPYTVRNSEQVVPLFYFEGETENLKQKADYLSGWDLAYLKFCCKVQGIRNELFNSENVAVISLTDIKSYFPNGTEFEDYWPNKVVDSNLLIGNRSNVNNAVNWTRQPAQPPPKALANGSWMSQQQQNNLQMSYAMLQAQAQQQAANARNAQYRNPMESLLLNSRQPPYGYNNPAMSMAGVNSHGQGNAPPPLIRSGSSSTNAAMSMHTASAAYLQQQQQQQQQQVAAAHQQQQQQRMSHQNGGNSINGSSSSVGGNSSRSSSNNSANSASVHLQRHAAMAASSAASVSLDGNRLCVIPEIPISNVSIQPYKVQKVFVDHHLVPCINMKAYTDSDQLMTLTDFRKYFFPSVSLEHCKRLIEALGVELYKGNRRQMQVIQENDRNHTENIPLVQVRDVIKYMTQLTFMIRSQDQQPHSKRVRVS